MVSSRLKFTTFYECNAYESKLDFDTARKDDFFKISGNISNLPFQKSNILKLYIL